MSEQGTGATPDAPPLGAGRGPGASASTRFSVAAAAGVCAGALVSLPGSWQLGTLAGWDVAAGVYVAWTWATVWHRDPASTSRLALREDPGRAVADAMLLVASVASVLAIGLAITAGRATGPGSRDLHAALAVASVALSWTVVQTVSPCTTRGCTTAIPRAGSTSTRTRRRGSPTSPIWPSPSG